MKSDSCVAGKCKNIQYAGRMEPLGVIDAGQ